MVYFHEHQCVEEHLYYGIYRIWLIHSLVLMEIHTVYVNLQFTLTTVLEGGTALLHISI